MSVQELILIPKQKFDNITKTSDQSKEYVSEETQIENNITSDRNEQSDGKTEQQFVMHRVRAGVP